MSASSDNRILIISEIGYGPPHLGNRARMAMLLDAIRDAGLAIHFAAVDMVPEERDALAPRVDRWVADFRPALTTRLRRRARAFLDPHAVDDRIRSRTDLSLDRLIEPQWLERMRAVQSRERYSRVLVVFVFHSAFFTVFGGDTLKVLETQDVFGDRDERLRATGLTNQWFSTTPAEERKGLLRADRIIAIQDSERELFRALIDNQREVLTVGHIQPSRFVPFDPGSAVRIGYFASDNPLNSESLHWFLERCWPQLHRRCPSARLVIGGRICRLVSGLQEGVEIAGEVSDPLAFHANTLFSINPMLGGTGMKIKTVEALAAGRAVVTLPAGAAGLEALVGRGLTVVEDQDAFVEACIAMLDRPAQAMALGATLPVTIDALSAAWRRTLLQALELPHTPGAAGADA